MTRTRPGPPTPNVRSSQRPPRTTGAVDILLILVAFGSAIRRPALPRNLAFVDALLVVVNLVAIGALLRPGNLGGAMFRRILPWLWLLAVGGMLGLFGVGLTLWSIDTLARVTLAPVTFCAILALLDGRPATCRRMRTAFLAAGLFIALTTIMGSTSAGARSSSQAIGNANYAAHFLLVSLVLLAGARHMRLLLRLSLVAIFTVAMFRTGSFGALAGLASGGAYWVLRTPTRASHFLRVTLSIVLLICLTVVASVALSRVSTADFDAGYGYRSDRLDFSRETRLALWQAGLSRLSESPFGIGPGGYRARVADVVGGPAELHSDPVAFIVEHGPLGFLAAITIIAVLWRRAPAAGDTRLLLCTLAGPAILRQTFNFRHLWIALAITMATDLYQRSLSRRAEPEDPPADPPDEPEQPISATRSSR